MSEERDPTQRRVYIFPTLLADRIVAYQRANGLVSEVEAVRQLLDEALKSKETSQEVMIQIYNSLIMTKSAIQTVRDVAFGHPKVNSLTFNGDGVEIGFIDGTKFRIDKDLEIEEWDRKGSGWTMFIPF